MTKTKENIARILAAGASVSIRASKPTEDLCELAGIARSHKVTLILRDVGKTTDDLVRIAAAGGANVLIELQD